MNACKVSRHVKKIIEPWNPLCDCRAATKTERGEISNLASNDVLDMASLDAGDAVTHRLKCLAQTCWKA